MAFIIWLSVLGVVLLIALAPITLRAAFDGELLVRLRIYGIPYTIAPRKKRKRAKAAGRKSGKISKKAIKADKKRRKNDPLSISQMLKEDGVGAVLAYLKGMASLMNTLVRRILNLSLIHISRRRSARRFRPPWPLSVLSSPPSGTRGA